MTEVEAQILRNQIEIMDVLARCPLARNKDRLRRAMAASARLLTADTMADIAHERGQPELIGCATAIITAAP